MTATAELLQAIEANGKRADRPLETKICEFAVWYAYHKDTIPKENLAKRLEFQEKALSNLLDLMTLMMERLYVAEGRAFESSIYPGSIVLRRA